MSFLILGAFACSFSAKATVPGGAENPYANIVVRNVFGLRPPPPPAPPPPDPAKEPSDITLTGIITIGGKRALMKTRTKAKPPAKPEEKSYILAEGQRDGDIEVLNIDAAAGKVKVNNHGKIETLDFEHNGPKLPSAASLAAAAAAPHPTRPVLPGAVRRLPVRNTIIGPRQIPPRPMRTSPGATAEAPGPPVSPMAMTRETVQAQIHGMTPEVQAAMIEVERERTKAQVETGQMPPLPPTAITPPGSPGVDVPLAPQ